MTIWLLLRSPVGCRAPSGLKLWMLELWQRPLRAQDVPDRGSTGFARGVLGVSGEDQAPRCCTAPRFSACSYLHAEFAAVYLFEARLASVHRGLCSGRGGNIASPGRDSQDQKLRFSKTL